MAIGIVIGLAEELNGYMDSQGSFIGGWMAKLIVRGLSGVTEWQ